LLYVDLVQGLQNDEYAVEFLQQMVKPAGLISTRMPVVSKAKKKSMLAVQRIFLLDMHALKTGYRLLETNQPDFVEVLPGVMPHMIREIVQRTQVPVLAGGLIRTLDDVKQALSAGAVAVTTSNEQLWQTNL
jgi:glycerol uptake operon antiterminator